MMLTVARHRAFTALVLAAALAAGCTPDAPTPNLSDGRDHFTKGGATGAVACSERPFELDANRVSLTIAGPCREAIVTGNHNDVAVDVLGGGVVEITGSHNDVTWRQAGPGPRPALLDRGRSNTFHRGAMAGEGP